MKQPSEQSTPPPQSAPSALPPADRLHWSYPENLPITARVEDIKQLWRTHPVVIIGGDTGSGKTTQLPKIALELGRGRAGRIGCTQPRRLAATAMARRVATELGVECGAEVGYQVRFDDRTRRDTVVKFMTDGILLAETRQDRKLRQYDTLIIDEAHERSLNIDFILGYLKNLLEVRHDLKIAISSATLDLESFSRFFNDAPIVRVEGRVFPVEDHFMEPESADEELEDQVARAVDFLSGLDARGDILVFLPGEREIRDCTELLTGRKLPNTEILPLYARLAAADQQKVFAPGRRRRVILATNVAETSITIPGIRFCIDSGLARISRYNPRSRIQELRIETVSRASVRQRRGRCGRTADGICVHLYSEDDLARADEYTDPEIKRTSLAGVILQMASLRLPRIDRFPFIDPPPPALIREGMRTLEDIRAVLPGGRLTGEGWKLAALPIDPHLGKMLAAAEKNRVLEELLIIVASLSIPDPRERPLDKQQAADDAHRKFRDEKSDFLAILHLWKHLRDELGEKPSHGALRRYCRTNFLNYNRMNEWRNLVADLTESCAENGWKLPETRPDPAAEPPYDAIHRSILAGIPRQIARYVPEYQYYLGTGGRKFTLFPGSGLFRRRTPPAWLLSFALVETSRVYGRQNAEIKPEYLEQVAPHLCVSVYEAPAWDPVSGFVYAREKLTSGGLVIHPGRRVDYARKNPKEAREIFIRAALVPGVLTLGTWVTRHAEMLRDLEHLERKLRRPGTVVDTEAIFEHFDMLLPSEITSTRALRELLRKSSDDYSMNRADAMQEQYHSFDERDYPDALTFSGHRFELRYEFAPGEEHDGMTLIVPEGEFALLPDWAADWLVPGYLGEKVELLLKILPKAVRRQLSPISERTTEFVTAVRSGDVLTEQPLTDALADFLEENHGVTVSPRDFADARLPEFLIMKLAELNADRKIRTIHRAMPERRDSGSRLGLSIRGVSDFARSGLTSWPADLALPLEMELPGSSGKIACPALTDDGESVGVQLFLRPAEAAARHRAGLLRLFRLGHADQIGFIRRTFRLSREMLLSWFATDRERRYPDELLNAAILRAFGADPADIRDAAAYAAAERNAAENLGTAADEQMAILQSLYTSYEALQELCRRLKTRHGVDSRDLRQHLQFLFAPGFLRRPAVWDEYARYLRAARLRAERLNNNPGKDAEKFQALAPWQEKFDLALATVPDLTAAPELYDFWLLLEEARIQCFAPEIRPREKSPLNRLEKAWNNLRF